MLKAVESRLRAAGAEDGMELVQAGFSIAVAACLGLVVTAAVTGWLVPDVRALDAPLAEVFETLAATGIEVDAPGGM